MRTMAIVGCCLLFAACGKSVIGDGKGKGGETGVSIIGGSSGTGGNGGGVIRKITKDQKMAIEENACAGWAYEPEGLPAKLELVIDVSGSMKDPAPGSSATKWEETRDALLEAIVGVDGPGLGASTAVGLLFYPGKFNSNVSTKPLSSSTECLNIDASVSMAELGGDGAPQRSAIEDALSSVETGQGTPTHDAYKYALDKVVLGDAQKDIPGDPYMLLITDGMPTLQYGCYNTSGNLDYNSVPTDPIVDEIANARSKGVKTFVIGSPGSEAGVGWLSAAATAGGTAKENCSDNGPTYCHMDMTTAPNFSAALRSGLNQVVSAVAGCKFDVPTKSIDGTEEVDPNQVYPFITYSNDSIELIGRDNGTGTCKGDGYRLLSDTQLELCKATCDRYHADPEALIEFMFGCAGIEEILQ
jgi:hypothetical protein